MKGDWCIQVVDFDENVMYLRNGPTAGVGPVTCFGTPKEAKAQVEFMKEGMERGEDYESISVVRWESIPKDERQ